MRILTLAILGFCASSVQAEIRAYKCLVTHAASLSESGEMASSDFTNLYIGKEFTLDKGTGRIQGDLSNSNAHGQPIVLDYGSSEQAFKAITIFQPFTSITYLYIEEFVEGIKKPFLILDGAKTYSGLCAPY